MVRERECWRTVARVAATVLLIAGAQAAHAQAVRSWVSGVGDDANPCSRTAPCKTFAGAISKTAAGGEISVLDSGSFGGVTITKSITINGEGHLAGITNSGINGIIVNAPADSVVTIRNLSVQGAGSGINGVRFLAGGDLHLENLAIAGMTGHGVSFEPSGTSSLFMRNVAIRSAGAGAVLVKPGATGTAHATLDDVYMDGNGRGLRAEDGSSVRVRNSRAADNTANGFVGLATGGRFVAIDLDNVTSAGNGATGVYAGALTTIRISNSTITRNLDGLQAVGGSIISFGNNRIFANSGNNGPPTTTAAQQ